MKEKKDKKATPKKDGPPATRVLLRKTDNAEWDPTNPAQIGEERALDAKTEEVTIIERDTE